MNKKKTGEKNKRRRRRRRYHNSNEDNNQLNNRQLIDILQVSAKTISSYSKNSSGISNRF
jgi:hypothetical protein